MKCKNCVFIDDGLRVLLSILLSDLINECKEIHFGASLLGRFGNLQWLLKRNEDSWFD